MCSVWARAWKPAIARRPPQERLYRSAGLAASAIKSLLARISWQMRGVRSFAALMNGAELKTDCNRFLLRTSYITGSRLLMHLASKLVRVDRADRKRNNSRAGMSLAYCTLFVLDTLVKWILN